MDASPEAADSCREYVVRLLQGVRVRLPFRRVFGRNDPGAALSRRLKSSI
jgi:hypothetical protein